MRACAERTDPCLQNSARAGMEMTTPVVQRRGEAMEMTTPVITRQGSARGEAMEMTTPVVTSQVRRGAAHSEAAA